MTKPKRGRPPRTIPFRDGTEITCAELGITRKQVSDWIAIASIPKDAFEARLSENPGRKLDRRRVSTTGLVRLAAERGTTNRKAPMHDATALEKARKAVAKLSPAERYALAHEIIEGLVNPTA